ncbi:hypothetical protein BOTBODRAFT_38292 [Botryobasidium botryosum FD-172 SS1]|uniref:Secreted protein n=1 Tax=Botryobasidium botryosum (strain FD-172 SS1) TaxID=930990 RepID=A0A067LXF4_BOTB1|nr:hypothetical protein BOTBODRAFT_38292 [Botryobasidium botryosum FD-172 SS1]
MSATLCIVFVAATTAFDISVSASTYQTNYSEARRDLRCSNIASAMGSSPDDLVSINASMSSVPLSVLHRSTRYGYHAHQTLVLPYFVPFVHFH